MFGLLDFGFYNVFFWTLPWQIQPKIPEQSLFNNVLIVVQNRMALLAIFPTNRSRPDFSLDGKGLRTFLIPKLIFKKPLKIDYLKILTPYCNICRDYERRMY